MRDHAAEPSDASRIQDLLRKARFSNGDAAAMLGVSETTFRAWSNGKQRIPRYVVLALESLVDLEVPP